MVYFVFKYLALFALMHGQCSVAKRVVKQASSLESDMMQLVDTKIGRTRQVPCQSWGTTCNEVERYGEKIRGRSALVKACNDDHRCRGIVFVSDKNAAMSPFETESGYGFKCKAAAHKSTSDRSHRFCRKDPDGGLVSLWETKHELTAYMRTGTGWIKTAKEATDFLKSLSNNSAVKTFLNGTRTGYKTMQALKAAGSVAAKLESALAVVEGVGMAFAVIGLMTEEETNDEKVNRKLDEIKAAISDLHHAVNENFRELTQLHMSSTELLESQVPVTTVSNKIDALVKNHEFLKEDDLRNLLNKLTQLQIFIMGTSAQKPLLDLHFEQLKNAYSANLAAQSSYDPLAMVDKLMSLSIRFNNLLRVQTDGILLLGSKTKMLKDDNEKSRYASKITDLLENIRIQQQQCDPLRKKMVRGTLSFIFAGETLKQLVESTIYLKQFPGNAMAEEMMGHAQKTAFEGMLQSTSFSRHHVETIKLLCGNTDRLVECRRQELRGSVCFPVSAKILVEAMSPERFQLFFEMARDWAYAMQLQKESAGWHLIRPDTSERDGLLEGVKTKLAALRGLL